jgi:FtsH-binding integral membrane protein
MAQFPQNPFAAPQIGYRSRQDAMSVAGFFNAVYGWMSAGLALTAVVAWVVSHNQAVLNQVFTTGGFIILVIAQLALVWTISGAIQRINATVATALFMVYAALNGVTLSVIFLMYAHVTIAAAFVVTAGMFGAASLYGFTTKRDMSGMAGILFMALIGLVIASIVNIFMQSSGLFWLITYGMVILFTVLTAFDTQRLLGIANQTQYDGALAARYSIVGALILYLDFINLFIYMLRILGAANNRR